LSGGNQIAQYFLLLGYLHNDGLYANTDDNRMANSNANYKRYNMRTNVDLQVTPRFSASLDLAGRVEDRSSPNYGTGSLWENMAKYPANAYPVTNPDDSWGGNALYPDNPVASVLDRGFNSSHDRLLTANLKLSQDLLKSPARTLKFSQVLAAHNWHRGNYDRTREYAYYELSPGSGDELVYTQYGTDTEYNTSEGGNDQWNRFNLQLALDFNRNYENQEFSAMLMYHQDVLHVSGNEVPFATQNINGRLNYNYQSRYYAELGLSYSGSERFQKGNRFGFFPALSGAWVISNEEFLENNSTLTFLKARASIGLVGSDRLVGERFAYQQDFYYSGNYRFGNSNNGTSTMMEGALGNPDLTWEKSLKSNIGIEGSLFNNLDFSLDVFYDRRTDILALSGASFPGYVGITPHYENVGSVNNRGFEIDLNYRNTLGGMDYFIGGGTSFSRNEITKMNEITRAEDYLYRTGHSVGQLFGLEAIGFFETGDFDESGNLNSDVPRPGFGPVQPGDIRYADQNNDGFVNENDELAIGKPWEPEINYHFSLGAQYKGFDIDLFFHGIANRDVYLSGPLFWALVDDGNIAPNALDRWTPENSANASYPRLTTLPNENNYRPSDFWTQSGDVLRLRNVEIGYTIPQALASQVQISNARIFFRGSNLFAWDKIESADPENINGYPVLKSYNMGVSLQF
ncbi:MAG: SusC/RagA family TonB-linked outer membrane protein, partial [Balneolales bacterium]